MDVFHIHPFHPLLLLLLIQFELQKCTLWTHRVHLCNFFSFEKFQKLLFLHNMCKMKSHEYTFSTMYIVGCIT